MSVADGRRWPMIDDAAAVSTGLPAASGSSAELAVFARERDWVIVTQHIVRDVRRLAGVWAVAPGLVLGAFVAPGGTVSAGSDGAASVRPVEEFSPAMIGPFRKLMAIEEEIERHAARYGVDPALAKAVCLYESGGNAGLVSSAGAQGYFQLMPPTFRAMRVGSNVEAGIKYLGQLTARFGREDYALAGYNGGPTRVGRGGPMPLESLQYVLGVGTYRTVLKLHEESLRAHARDLTLVTVGADDDWWRLSQRAGIPTVQLRLHNPFIAARGLRAGQRIAVPRRPRTDLFASPGLDPEYRVRLGDNALTLAFTLGIEPDRFREVNGLWRLQTLLPGNVLTIPLDRDGLVTTHRVSPGEDLGLLARRFNVDPWSIVRDNGLWDDRVEEGALLRIRTGVRAPAPRPAQPRTHVVRRGETLTAIAARYETTIPAIQSANALGRRTRILVGQRLRIPPG